MNILNDLPYVLINTFISKLEALCSKYEMTFAEVESRISEAEASLELMLENMTGNEYEMKAIAELKTLLARK